MSYLLAWLMGGTHFPLIGKDGGGGGRQGHRRGMGLGAPMEAGPPGSCAESKEGRVSQASSLTSASPSHTWGRRAAVLQPTRPVSYEVTAFCDQTSPGGIVPRMK